MGCPAREEPVACSAREEFANGAEFAPADMKKGLEKIQKRFGDLLLEHVKSCLVYNSELKTFLERQADGEWIEVQKDQAIGALWNYFQITDLRKRLFDGEGRAVGWEQCSDAEDILFYLTRMNRVHISSKQGFAGYRAGIHEIGGTKCLTLKQLSILRPQKGPWDTIRRFLTHLFGGQDGAPDGHRQFERFLTWCSVLLRVVHGIYHGNKRLPKAQSTFLVLMLIGPSQMGKSFTINHILSPMLGGVTANPFQHMAGETAFNADTATPILQVCDDARSANSHEQRKQRAQWLKEACTGGPVRIHGKGRDAVSIPLLWAHVYSMNDGEDSITAAPALIEGMLERLLVLRTTDVLWPGFANNHLPGKREQLEEAIHGELAAFVHHLLYEFIPAEDLLGSSFGCKDFIHPEIKGRLDALTPEARLRDALVGRVLDRDFEGSANSLLGLMQTHLAEFERAHFPTSPYTLGRSLSKLCRMYPDEFTDAGKSGDVAVYHIRLKRTVKVPNSSSWSQGHGNGAMQEGSR